MGKKDPRTHDFLRDLELRHEHDTAPAAQETLLGIDYGAKVCGLAVCSNGVILSAGLCDTSDILPYAKNIIREKHITTLVLGWPVGSDGARSPQCADIQSLGDQLKKSLPVVYVDERDSSKYTLAPNTRERRDDLAAMNILKYYLRQKSMEKKQR